MMKEFRGHTSYVQCVLWGQDQARIVTGSADGYVKVWDVKAQACVSSFNAPTVASGMGNILAINQIPRAPRNKDRGAAVILDSLLDSIYISSECRMIWKMNLRGQVLKT